MTHGDGFKGFGQECVTRPPSDPPIGPTDRPRDLYGSLSRRLDMWPVAR